MSETKYDDSKILGEIRQAEAIQRNYKVGYIKSRFLLANKPLEECDRWAWERSGFQAKAMRNRPSLTYLYMIRAHMHGKVHMKDMPFESQFALIRFDLVKYIINCSPEEKAQLEYRQPLPLGMHELGSQR
jgi:hypothetical protein